MQYRGDSRLRGNDGREGRNHPTMAFPPPPTVIPAQAGIPTVEGRRSLPDRPSRVSGNPDGTEKTRPLPPNRRRIPAYAGMTVETAAPSIRSS